MSSPHLTPERVRRKLLLVVGRQVSATLALDGVPLAGWMPLLRTSGPTAGRRVWLKCKGRPHLRYTEPRAFRHAAAALTYSEAEQLRLEFHRRD